MHDGIENKNLLSVEMLQEVDNCETSFIAKKQWLLNHIMQWVLS
ncbi:hypothetical protein [Lactobacillus sp. M0396]|nr:hypothetical protein [Lactobacillus sp. M0396]